MLFALSVATMAFVIRTAAAVCLTDGLRTLYILAHDVSPTTRTALSLLVNAHISTHTQKYTNTYTHARNGITRLRTELDHRVCACVHVRVCLYVIGRENVEINK